MVMIDMMNIAYMIYYTTKKNLSDEIGEFNEESLPFFYHFFLNKINYIIQDYGKITICWEGKKSLEWRRSVYSEYKLNRSEHNKNSLEIKTLNKGVDVLKKVLKFYPIKQIEVEKAEADDIIFVLSGKYKDEGVTILSTDRDLVQTMNYYDGDIEIYNPIFKKFLEPNLNIIEQKSIVGDRSDNIPGLHMLGIKTFEKMINNEKYFEEKIGPQKILYEKFKKIIDLSQLPDNIKNSILDKDEQEEYSKFDPESIEMFFWENKLKDILDRWPGVSSGIYRKIS